ncbi:MAG TPA: hypothetical protein VFT45_12040 [Longimicrobium sp.]|nr:hypothetical protein [Longimicrobium sp.]
MPAADSPRRAAPVVPTQPVVTQAPASPGGDGSRARSAVAPPRPADPPRVPAVSPVPVSTASPAPPPPVASAAPGRAAAVRPARLSAAGGTAARTDTAPAAQKPRVAATERTDAPSGRSGGAGQGAAAPGGVAVMPAASAVAPAQGGGRRRGAEAAPEPPLRIDVGRIDVRAAAPETAAGVRARRGPQLTLERYLRQGGRRG